MTITLSGRTDGCVSEFALDAFDAGAATKTERASIESHLAGCSACASRLETIRQGFAAFPELDERRVLAAVRREAERPAKTSALAWLVRLVLPLAVAAGALALVVSRPDAGHRPSIIRTKGDVAAVHVFRERDGLAKEAMSGDAFRPGESLQLFIDLTEPSLVRVVDVAPGGQSADVWPADGAFASLAAGRHQRVPGAVALDDAKGDDTLYVVACAPAAKSPGCTFHPTGDLAPACAPGCEATSFVLARSAR